MHYRYQDVLNAFNVIQKRYTNAGTKDSYLITIKKYYDYLIDRELREDHPCKTLYLKKRINKNFVPDNVFTPEELERLMEREERFEYLRLKNKSIVSLLIYQGLYSGEIAGLKLQHIDLDNGTIYIGGTGKSSARKLELHSKQYRLFDQYINHSRKRQLIKENSNSFLIGYHGTPITVDDINYLMETLKPLFPDRNLNALNIRNSVIYNLLNVKRVALEQVQLFAGHKWISTTQRYLHAPMDEQRELINKWFPV